MTEIKAHTPEWDHNKKEFLSSNDCACHLNNGYSTNEENMHRKINYIDKTFTPNQQKRLERGSRYERIVRDLCASRHGVTIVETGQKFHPEIDFITSTPDGIINNTRLVEFKVRRKIGRKVPFKYWIQMQIQMQVWNKTSCLFCDNVIHEYNTRQEYLDDVNSTKPRGEFVEDGHHYYWKLEDFFETVVKRDDEWFARVLPELQKTWKVICYFREQNKKRKRKRTSQDLDLAEQLERDKFYKNKAKMIDQYQINNFFLDDTILDWCDIHLPEELRDPDNSKFSLNRYIYNRSIQFRSKLKKYFMERTPDKMFIDIESCYHPKVFTEEILFHNQLLYFERFTQTQAAIDSGIPIIFNAGLYDPDANMYGKAEILVRIDLLQKLLRVPDVFIKPEQSHYIIIMATFGTLNLCSDGVHLLSNSKQNIYKGQAAFLNLCLSKMQRFTVSKALIIGRKSDFTREGEKYKFNSCFSRLGVIDFAEKDSHYLEKIDSAIEWIEKVRLPSSKDMKIFPNMKNHRDYPWHNYKVNLAQEIGEITSMYYCGAKVRDELHKSGVDHWQDLTETNLPGKGKKIKKHITAIVKATNNDEPEHTKEITEQLNELKQPVEFFVDFEAVNGLNDDLSLFPQASGDNIIFMIGSTCVNNQSGDLQHDTYVVDRLNKSEEKKILKQWITDMIRKNPDGNKIYIYHWGYAEKSMINRAFSEHNFVSMFKKIELIDLCKMFKSVFMALPGVFSYNIKRVAKKLHQMGKIATIWQDNDIDGSAAMVAAFQAEDICQRDNKTFKQIDFMGDMIKYNYVDCKVMHEIVEHFRLR